VRKLSFLATAVAAIGLLAFPALAELGTNTPPNDDDTLLTQREIEADAITSTMRHRARRRARASSTSRCPIPTSGINRREEFLVTSLASSARSCRTG